MKPIDFLVSPGIDGNIDYTGANSTRRLAGNLILTETTDANSRQIVRLSGTPTPVLENTPLTIPINVTKKTSTGNVSFRKESTLTVLAHTQPQWVTPPGAIGNSYSESQSVSISLVANPQVIGDIVRYGNSTHPILNGSLPSGLSLTSSNNRATISGVPDRVAVDTISTFTVRATEYDYNGVKPLGVSDRTFSIKVTGPTPPSFITPAGMLGDMSSLYFATIPAPLISNISIDSSNKVIVSVSPYNLKNYGLTNNTAVYLSGIVGTGYSGLNNNLYYVGDADPGNSKFTLYQNAGLNNTPTNPLTIASHSDWSYTSGGTVARTSPDSIYFETHIAANANDPGTTVVYSLDSGTLPDGLELSNTGKISGYPTSSRTTLNAIGTKIYWGAVDVNGTPCTKLTTFTVKITTASGSATANYSIGITNQESAWKIGQTLAGTNYTFPGRAPVLLNNQPLTQTVSNTDQYFNYYFSGTSLGKFTQDNQFMFKFIGKNFNATDQQDSDYGVEYTIKGLKSGYPDSTNAFTSTKATINTNNASIILGSDPTLTQPTVNSTIKFTGPGVGNTKYTISNVEYAANANTYISNTAIYYVHSRQANSNVITISTSNDSNASNVVVPSASGVMYTPNVVNYLVSPDSSNNAPNGWINGTLGNLGTDIKTYKFTVQASVPNLVTSINTNATFSNTESMVLVGNTYGLRKDQLITFTGNSVGNISNTATYFIKSVGAAISTPARIANNNTTIYVDTVAGLNNNSTVTFSGYDVGIIDNQATYTISSVEANVTTTATFGRGTSNILVSETANLIKGQPVVFTPGANVVVENQTYYIGEVSNTLVTTGTTNYVNSNIKVNSTLGLETGTEIALTSVASRVYQTTANRITANTNQVVILSNGGVRADQLVSFTGTSFGGISNTANYYKVDAIGTQSITYTSTVMGNPVTNTINVSVANLKYAGNSNPAVFTANANGSMTVKFYEPNPSNVTLANYYIDSVDTANSTVVFNKTNDGNTSNILSPNANASITFTSASNNITVTKVAGTLPAIIPNISDVTIASQLTSKNPRITIKANSNATTNITPNATGVMNLVYIANSVTISNTVNGNAITANATGTMTLVSSDTTRIYSQEQEFSFTVQGSVSSGVGWSGTGNLGTINNGEISRLSVSAVFGSDTLSTTATLTANVANIKLDSAKSLANAQPITFTGNSIGNISNVAQYYIKGTPDLANNLVQISKSITGNAITPNVSGTITLQSQLDDSRYRLVDGNLPAGLKLLSTGDIIGRPAFESTSSVQAANTTTAYTFTVEGYSKTYPEITTQKTYTLSTVQKYTDPYDNLYVRALMSQDQRTKIDNVLTHISGAFNNSTTKDIYRPRDPNFGVASEIKYGHMYGVPSKYTSVFEEAYQVAIAQNHYFKQLVLGELKTAIARDKTGAIVYEVVYSQVVDSMVNSQGTSVSKSVLTDAGLVYPNSLIQMREQIKSTIGIVDDSSLLPLWMVTQQSDGNVTGYIPCWVLCYTKPGKSAAVLASVKTYLSDNGFELNQMNFAMDRFVVDRSLTWTYGGAGTTEWPTITATVTGGNANIKLSSIVGLSVNTPVQFTGNTVGNVVVDTTYYVTNLSSNTMTIRTALYGNATSTTLTPNASGTLNLVTTPLSATARDDSRDTPVVFTQTNVLK
jgi:hypothetical protein